MKNKKYDFGGWATKNNLKCSDGRTIRHNAFGDNDGKVVPLVWSHQHNEPEHVLGHALLENRDEGVYCYGSFNDTSQGQIAKTLVQHGDIVSLSIYANKLKQIAADVVHGNICEVSLVYAGANPGAYIDTVIAHSEDNEEEAVIYTGENGLTLRHEEDSKEDKKDKDQEKDSEDEESLDQILETLSAKQKETVYNIIGQALDKKPEENEKEDEELKGGDKTMKHNLFDRDERDSNSVLSHSTQEEIIKMAKSSQVGTFKTAIEIYAADNNLQHDAVSSGFVQTGEGNVYNLFPEYQEVRPGAPELITNDQGWISAVLNKVHKSPISRIRTSQVDIRNIEALRAKGYTKGKKKSQTGNFKLVRRTTDPQTVYVKNALHRDDIIDIVDFDYVDYLYNIDKMSLNEELATAIMLGDSREDGDEGKIFPEHIRPIWLDDELYTLHVNLDIEQAKKELQGTNTAVNFGKNYVYAEAIVEAVLHAREQYKGTGTPDFYCTPTLLNIMLLARDMNGRRIYSTKAELASTLNVGEIYTAEQFAGKTRTTDGGETKKLLGIVANLADYSLGATKGGEVTHFTQFDIDFNQEKSLLETRCSGALTRVYSAIALEEDVVAEGRSKTTPTSPVGGDTKAT